MGFRAAVTIVGASVGGAVGRSMDSQDRLKTRQALQTVRTGVPAQWTNPDTGHRNLVTPTRTFDSGGGPCRESAVDALIGGRAE